MQSENQEKTQKKRGGVRKVVTNSSGRYNKTKYKALNPEVNLKTRYEELEDIASYADQLSEEDKEWLNRFAQEYVCANFNHDGEVLHDTDELRKDCFARNNARNRDIYTKLKAQNEMNYIEDLRNTRKESVTVKKKSSEGDIN